MIGMNRKTGKSLAGLDHLRQSVEDILTTPRGTRVLCREYGSNLFEIIDKPFDPALITYEIADALGRWEPRIKVKKVDVVMKEPGHVDLTIHGNYQGEPISLGASI